MAASSDSLYDLVKLLSDSEKKGIRKILSSGKSDKNPSVQFIMFGLLSGMRSYNEDAFKLSLNAERKRNRQPPVESDIKTHKNYLKNEILWYLGNNTEGDFKRYCIQHEAINILYHRGLIKEANKQIDKFKKEVKGTAYDFFIPRLNEVKIMIVQHSGGKDIRKRVNEIADENLYTLKNRYRTALVYAFYAKIFNLQVGGPLVTDKNTLEEIRLLEKDEVFLLREEEMDDNQKHLYFLARTGLARLRGDYKTGLDYAEKSWQLSLVRLQHPEYKTNYFREIVNAQSILSSSIEVRIPGKMPAVYLTMKGWIEEHHPKNDSFILALRHYKFNMAAMKGPGKELQVELDDLLKFYRSNFTQLDPNARKSFEIDLIIGFIALGDFEKTIHFIGKLIGEHEHFDYLDRNKLSWALFRLTIYYDYLVYSEGKGATEDRFIELVATFKRQLREVPNADIDTAFIACFELCIKHGASSEHRRIAFQNLDNYLDEILATENSSDDRLQFNQIYLRTLECNWHLHKWVKQKAERKQKRVA